MFVQRPLHNCDSYKLGHMAQYPKGTNLVYSNFTPRAMHHAKIPDDFNTGRMVWFGLQGTLQEIKDLWDKEFFFKPKELVIKRFARRIESFVGPTGFDISKVEALHDLGYLPLRFKALPEGTLVGMKIPVFTVVNTLPGYYWLTNYMETWLSTECWKISNSATIAYTYRKILTRYAELTGAPMEFIDWQAHDFSLRGMSGIHDGAKSGAGHQTSFLGTDSLPALDWLEDYYMGAQTFLGGSVPATEHSVMCMGGMEDELETFRRLITEIYPAGIVSIVSDTWDFWKVITQFTVALREQILARKPDALGMAKVVFRPDSGDPIDILCGTAHYVDEVNEEVLYSLFEEYDVVEYVRDSAGNFYAVTATVNSGDEIIDIDWRKVDEVTPEMKGAVECLWEIFGGDFTSKGFKVLNQRVGLIYGDSITMERAAKIMDRLYRKGFASCNTVLGVGSYTYQYNTRDTLGFAMKATYGEVNGVGRAIFKDPKTDNGMKKSATGLLRVERLNGEYVLFDNQTWEQEAQGELRTVFENGVFYNLDSIETIRTRLRNEV
jgi:nicotinamide phosphoribosyltransferase